MNRRERLLAAIRHQPVDRVPFATYNLNPAHARHAKDPSYASLCAWVRERGGVYAKVGPPRIPNAADAEIGSRTEAHVEEQGDTTVTTRILHTPKGDLRAVSAKPKDQPGLQLEHYVKTDEDIERYMSLPFEPHEYDPEPLRQMVEDLAEYGVVMAGYGDPFHAVAVVMDFNDLAMRCVTDLPSVQRFADFFYEQILAETRGTLKACEGLPVGLMTGGPELCTPPMMSPALFPTLVTRYHQKLIEVIHEAGFFAGIHCHGRVRDVFPEILKTGTDYLEPIEPPPQGDITLVELLDQADGRLCLIGHIQDQELHYVPPATMARHVEDIARVAKGRTGYIMTPTCTPFQHPAKETFVRNYLEWMEAAERLL